MPLPRALQRLGSRLSALLGRRKHARRPCSAVVDWHQFGSKVGHISSLVDLSEGGACVRAAYPRDVGSPIVMELPSPDGPIHVHARVAWSSDRGMGLRFTRPIPTERAAFAAI